MEYSFEQSYPKLTMAIGFINDENLTCLLQQWISPKTTYQLVH